MSRPLRQSPKGLFLHVRATAKSARDEIVGMGDNHLHVKVTAPPDKGKANAAIVKLLAKSMDVAKSSFELALGDTGRNKVFRIVTNEDAVARWVM